MKHEEMARELLGQQQTFQATWVYERQVKTIADALAQVEAETLERVIGIVRNERVSNTGTEGDIAYNVALDHVEQAIRSISLNPTPTKSVVPEGWKEMLDFLCGAGPLEGVWFGEKHPTEQGSFWWRKRLRALAAPDTDVSVSGGLIDGWMPIETAPRDGTTVELWNSASGLRDVGRWCDYTGRDYGIDGEWDQVNGPGDMTHWRPLCNLCNRAAPNDGAEVHIVGKLSVPARLKFDPGILDDAEEE